MHLVKIEGQTHSARKGQPRGHPNHHCGRTLLLEGGGGVRVPSIITHKISSPQGWTSGCPTRGGGDPHHYHCRHHHWGGRVSGRGPFAQKRVLAGVACTGLVYYMRVTCPVPVLLLCPYHLEHVVARVYLALSSAQHQLE